MKRTILIQKLCLSRFVHGWCGGRRKTPFDSNTWLVMLCLGMGCGGVEKNKFDSNTRLVSTFWCRLILPAFLLLSLSLTFSCSPSLSLALLVLLLSAVPCPPLWPQSCLSSRVVSPLAVYFLRPRLLLPLDQIGHQTAGQYVLEPLNSF